VNPNFACGASKRWRFFRTAYLGLLAEPCPSVSSQFTFPHSIAFGLVASEKAQKLSKNIEQKSIESSRNYIHISRLLGRFL
jgi:hypothetical protein